MKQYKGILILLNLVAVLLLFTWSVVKKEKTLTEGQLILLALAPVDPRSLIQGDYMQLNYAISRIDYGRKLNRTGYFVVTLDSGHVASLVRIQAGKTPLQPGEFLIRYKAKNEWNLYLGAEAYFFEEGQAEKFGEAKFGGLKVDKDGGSILVGLYNEQHKLLKP